ncbi:MAG: mevalonate kinase [Chloroflexi bacterium]|nr:mevalonate kinase [Chloroflexota bacterium]
MPAFSASAPGKIILFGEHAVVYGQPALAAPVAEVSARVTVTAEPRALRGSQGSVRLIAPEIELDAALETLSGEHPLAAAVRQVQSALKVKELPACNVRIASTIPVAAGLGSGAAVSVALIRALSAFLGASLSVEQVSALAYEVEKLHHGSPSGIDNTVIAHALPVYYQRGQPIQVFHPARPFTMVIGDTGVASPTADSVAAVRRAREADPARYEFLFAAAGGIARKARQAIEAGETRRLGAMMEANQGLLQEIGVSSPELERLIAAALEAGAWGAKLSGGGRGGNMIALAPEGKAEKIQRALLAAGAARALITTMRDHSA